MGIVRIEFEVVSTFTIDLPIRDNEFIDEVENDVFTIANDCDAKIKQIICNDEMASFRTRHGYTVRPVDLYDIRLSKKGEETVEEEVEFENSTKYGIDID